MTEGGGAPDPRLAADVRPDGPGAPPTGELGRAARGGLVTLVGAVASSGLGFVFSVLLARELGAVGAGVVFQTIAVFTIALSLVKLGLDTAAVWLLPRLVQSEPTALRAAVLAMLVPALVAAVVTTASWFAVRPLLLGGAVSEAVVDSVSLAAWFLPAASLMTVALAATRGLGGVLPFTLIGNVAVPLLRPALLVALAAGGGAVLGGVTSWVAPWLGGAAAALVVLHRQLDRHGASGWVLRRELRGRIARFALPRTLASGLEQTVVWLDVILVGVILGSAEAGVYGAASRFVSAGVIIATALRIVVAPRFSALLAREELGAVEELYRVTARWILLLGAPVYVVLAVFAPTVLSWLGPGFDDGVPATVVLCCGSIVVLAAGNVQALLLMSGRSGWSAFNKLLVVAFNVTGNVVLLPRYGITAAAATWAASMALDTVLAALQVRRAAGVSVAAGAILRTLVAVVATVAAPALAVVAVAGQGLVQLVVAGVLAVVLLGAYCRLDRRRLRLQELVGLSRGRSTSPGPR
ncbi:oligosaccharide flippase family protein [Nocardioides dongxiaopingii]|uniref:oligosaccharide flippase family protein n=1 Tax=Nocardioides sp. S-1144 TaxID=2582905 RepID=UPI001651B93A|nr:oligosaccharide flippase family protein [Nocardioides sp. S-1144]